MLLWQRLLWVWLVFSSFTLYLALFFFYVLYVCTKIESFHFLDQSFAENKDWDQTAQLWSQSRVKINQSCLAHITTHSIMSSLTSSLISPYFFFYLWISKKNEVIFVHQNLISNWLTYLVHAKSIGELISFVFSDRSVRSLVSAKRSANCNLLRPIWIKFLR